LRIAVTGSGGQLGRLVVRELEHSHEVVPLDRSKLEITNPRTIQIIADLQPDLVIHNAAMTDVDACARDPAQAFRVNAFGTQNVTLACQRANAAMLYVSTNEVFDGEKLAPYLEFDTPRPLNAYGKSKLAGEWFTQHLLQRFYIVRTAWLYARGSGKFPDKVLDLARRRVPLAYVTDEIGCPTFAPDLAAALARLITSERYGIYHLVNSGSCSRYEWAVEILQLANLPRAVKPITLADFSRASAPPKNGALENFAAATLDISLRPWQDALRDFFNA
jgi:dTDP-4-dehydrorhamnose reductase